MPGDPPVGVTATRRLLEGGATRPRPHRRLPLSRVAAALSVPLALLGLLTAGAPAAGHGADGVFVEPPIAQPGQELLIHGTYLWSDATITLTLVAIDGTSSPMGTTTTDGNGTLSTPQRLPEDTRPGSYMILLQTASGETRHVDLVVEPRPGLPVPALAGGALFAIVGGIVIGRIRARGRRRDSGSSAGPGGVDGTPSGPA